MAKMNVYIGFFLLLRLSYLSRVQSTCVFESDFGFKLNCAFKKSSLFRVRNLGGIKAHVGLGFSVGDELGFDQSLTNLDTNKRRSVGITNGSPYNSLGNTNQAQQKSNRNKNKQNRITVRQPSSSVAPSSVTQRLSSTIPVTEKITIQGRSAQGSVRQMSPNKSAIPPFKPIPPAQEMLAPAPTVQSFAYQNSNNRASQINQNRMGQTAKTNYVNLSAAPVRVINGQSVSNAGDQALRTIPAPSMTTFPQFAAMPASISRISTAAIQVADSPSQNIGMSVVSPQAYKNSVNIQVAPTMMNKFPNIGSYPSNTISLNKKSPPTQSPIYSPQFIANRDYSSKPTQKIDNMLTYNIISGQNGINDYSPQSTLQQKIAALSRATNISMETIEAAVRLRQNQLIQQMLNANPSTTTTTTTQAPRPPPPPPQPLPTLPPKRQYQAPPQQTTPTSKVMNAPKEYYPVGYEKNYDDNFITKVDLPETSFYCGDQKHFPGLYGDEDLGCMVFHVCALTDDGLIMKSFLCPESTLFDQTILKCNWWFYVDCKSSKKLYDSNIPISKSYQLMKALTFFSSYKKDIQDADQNSNVPKSTIEENRDGVNNAIKIIQNQANMQLPKVEIVEVNKTDSQQVIRNSKYFTPVNVKEVNALSVAQVDEKENVSEEKDDPPPEVKKPERGLYRAFSERKEVILDKFTPSAVEDVSTEKSTQKSMSVERTVIKRRPSVSWRIATSNSTDSDKIDSKENRRHRTERASEEVEDVSTNEYIISTTATPKVIIDEVTKSSMNTLIHLSHSDEVRKTIAKMDEAIIGQMKPDT